VAKDKKCHSCGGKYDFGYGANGGEPVPWCWECFQRDCPEKMNFVLEAREAAQKALDLRNAQ
jgi:hypothetical protein